MDTASHTNLPCCQETLLAHVQVTVSMRAPKCLPQSCDPEVSLLPAFFQGGFHSQVQGSAFAHVKFHKVPVSPFLQSREVPLNSSPALVTPQAWWHLRVQLDVTPNVDGLKFNQKNQKTQTCLTPL